MSWDVHTGQSTEPVKVEKAHHCNWHSWQSPVRDGTRSKWYCLQRERFYGSAKMVPTIIEQKDDGLSQRIPRFLCVFVEHFLRVSKRGDNYIATGLAILVNTPFEKKISVRYRRSVAEKWDVCWRKSMELINNDEFQWVLVGNSGVKIEGHCSLYVEDVTEVPWK